VDNLVDCVTVSEAVAGIPHRHEKPARLSAPISTDIRREGPSRVLWQRQTIDDIAFPVHNDFARPPVDVVECEPNDLAVAQPEPCRHRRDEVPFSPGSPGTGYQPLGLKVAVGGIRVEVDSQRGS
jgi:hypothetical protein